MRKWDKLIKAPLRKHSTLLEHGRFGGRKGQLVQQIETKHFIQEGVSI